MADEPIWFFSNGSSISLKLASRRTVSYTHLEVYKRQILDLFAMTPYYWKTPRSGAERLASLDTLTAELHFDFLVYRRAHA